MSLLSKLFGASPKEPAKPATTEYQGFTITPSPMKEGKVFRLSALIEKDGETHHLIRADDFTSADAANAAAIAKAKQVIDQQGVRLFS